MQAPPVLTELGRQALPATGCAAYLWRTGPTPQFVAVAEATGLRVAVEGRIVTLARTAARGETRLGLAASGDYAGRDMTATLDMTVSPRSDLTNGARVSDATLAIARTGGDVVIVPLEGLVGCALPPR